ncbi:MAG: hypothetical protein ACLSAH_13620 [Bilophila wadsworthia]
MRFQERPRRERGFAAFGRGALRNEETTLLHVLLERDADPAVLREALSPPSPLLRMVQLTDAQGRTPLHIAAARANPAALLLLHCMGARDTTPDREGRLALDIIQELGADEMAARLPFWENRGKQEGRMVVNLQQSKTVQIRGRKYRLEAKGFLSYASCHERGRARLCRRRSGRRGLPARR